MKCYDDPAGEQRARVETALGAPGLSEWRSEVGLTADPSALELVTEDALCQRIWAGIGWGQEPIAGAAVTFFRLGDRYIVADYAIYDEQTIVVDDNFKPVNPILAD